MGKAGQFCPYYYTFQSIDNFELIFLPYTYLMQYKILKSIKINFCIFFYLENAIVIIDEAHNIEKIAEEGYSFLLNMQMLDRAETDVKMLFDKLNSKGFFCKQIYHAIYLFQIFKAFQGLFKDYAIG